MGPSVSERSERFYAFRLPDGTFEWAYQRPLDGLPLDAVAWFQSLKLVREYVSQQNAILRAKRDRGDAQQELMA